MGVFCVTKMKHSLTIWFCRDEHSFAMLFWEDMITLISMLEVLLFLLSIWTFILNHLDLNIHATIKKNILRIMQGSIPHQKFSFYHLPTRGWAGIKLGDAWYVSSVFIIFYYSMLLYYPFWMFMGFILHIYIIFGTNLLTRGPSHILVLLPVSVFRRKGISNGVQTEWNLPESYFWNGSNPRDLELTSRKLRCGHEAGRRACPLGVPPTLVGPSWLPWPTSFAYIYPYTLKTSENGIDREFRRRKPL